MYIYMYIYIYTQPLSYIHVHHFTSLNDTFRCTPSDSVVLLFPFDSCQASVRLTGDGGHYDHHRHGHQMLQD